MAESQMITGMNLNDENLTPWDGSFSMPDPGTYLATMGSAEKGQSKGTPPVPQITLEWVLDGALNEAGEVTDQGAGQTIKCWINLDPSKQGNRRRLKHIVNVLGVPVDAKGNFDLAKMVGKQAVITVTASTYKKTDPQTGDEIERESRQVSGEQPVNFEGAEAPVEEEKAAPASAPAAKAPAMNGGTRPPMTRPAPRVAARTPARS